MKKLVACFDGTWNRPESGTNVISLYRAIKGRQLSDLPQSGNTTKPPAVETLKFYDAGVGTEPGERLRGGLGGSGLSRNIRQGYKFLVDNFEPGDEIYALGFSRGAYTTRSLVGLIRNVGLIKKEHTTGADVDDPSNAVIEAGYSLYRKRDASADTEEAVEFRTTHSHFPVPIKLIGVWDTVGALGIPLSIFRAINDSRYGFHDTKLSSSVENAFHALAVDEHREEYAATLWNPDKAFPGRLEQQWFVGAHSDVGGGAKEVFSGLTLDWMADRVKLEGQGLDIDDEFIPATTQAFLGEKPSDSFEGMADGWYARLKRLFGFGRHYRPIRQTQFGNERIDPTVQQKQQSDRGYRPKNIGL